MGWCSGWLASVAVLAAAVPVNRWLLVYAGLALVALTLRGPLLVEPVAGRAAVHGDVLAGDIADQASLSRNRATLATSAGSPASTGGSRRSRAYFATCSGVLVSSAVLIQPGEIAFTLIRCRPRSLAIAWTSMETPALLTL